MIRLTLWPADSPNYRLVKGNVRDWLAGHNIPAMRSARAGGWFVRTERVPDLLARAELDGVRVVIKDGAR